MKQICLLVLIIRTVCTTIKAIAPFSITITPVVFKDAVGAKARLHLHRILLQVIACGNQDFSAGDRWLVAYARQTGIGKPELKNSNK